MKHRRNKGRHQRDVPPDMMPTARCPQPGKCVVGGYPCPRHDVDLYPTQATHRRELALVPA